MNNKKGTTAPDTEWAGTPSTVLDQQRETVQINLAQKLIHELYKSNFEDLVERLTRAGH